MDLEETIRQHRRDLTAAAEALRRTDDFSLEAPCGLITDDGVVATTISGLRAHLKYSTALASEPIERFLNLQSEVGFDSAFETLSSDDEDGEAFCEMWDNGQKDLQEGAVMTLNDLVAMAEQARTGWLRLPRRMLVVALRGSEVASGTVPVDWVLAGT